MAIYFICQPDFKGNTLYFLPLSQISLLENDTNEPILDFEVEIFFEISVTHTVKILS